MSDEDFELMPQKTVNQLKRELESLKAKKGDDGEISQKKLLSAMENLTRLLEDMMRLFKVAIDEMQIEQKEETAISHQMSPLGDRLDKIIEQNEKIAKGMVAVADMVNDVLPKLEDELIEKPTRRSEPKIERESSPAFDFSPQSPPMGSLIPEASPFGSPPSFGPPPVPRPPSPPLQFGAPSGMPPPPPPGGPFMPPPPMNFDDLSGDDKPKKKGLMGLFKK